MIQGMFGSTPFEKVSEGIANRMVMMSAIKATKELIRVYEDIDRGILYLKEIGDEETVAVMHEALKDENVADKELVALADMLERNMGISA